MIQIAPEYLSTKAAAQYIGIPYETFRKEYPAYEQFGVIARKDPRKVKGPKRFKVSELNLMMDQWKVVK